MIIKIKTEKEFNPRTQLWHKIIDKIITEDLRGQGHEYYPSYSKEETVWE